MQCIKEIVRTFGVIQRYVVIQVLSLACMTEIAGDHCADVTVIVQMLRFTKLSWSVGLWVPFKYH